MIRHNHSHSPPSSASGNSSLLGLPLSSAPDLGQRFTGFGRLSLPGCLPLLGSTYDPGLSLQVLDMVPIKEGEVHSYSLTSTGGPLTAVLVWWVVLLLTPALLALSLQTSWPFRYDYPADVNSVLAIVNDLDLAVQVTKVTATGGGGGGGTTAQMAAGGTTAVAATRLRRQTYLGNGPSSGGGQPDRLNTVERVSIKNVTTLANIVITVSTQPALYVA